MGLINQQTSLGTTLFGDMAFVGPFFLGPLRPTSPTSPPETDATGEDVPPAVTRPRPRHVKNHGSGSYMDQPSYKIFYKWIN